MQIESWVITVFLTAAAVISLFAVMRYRVDANERLSDKNDSEIHKRLEAFGKKIDEHSESLREHDVKIQQAPTMKEVRQEFVTKELFQQHKDHLDRQFEQLGKHLDSSVGEIKEILNRRH